MTFDEPKCEHEWDHRWRMDGARVGYNSGYQSNYRWKEKCRKCAVSRSLEHNIDVFRGVDQVTEVGPHSR